MSISWDITGNAGTDPNHNFLGTTDGKPLVIQMNGNVGIGTTTPASKLQVETTTGGYGITQTDGTIIVGTFVGGGLGGAHGSFGTKSNHPLFFFVNNSAVPAMTIATSGNVGIGTTTPADKLQVETTTGSYGITQTDGTIAVGTFVGGSAVGGGFGTKSNHPLFFFANNSAVPAITIATSGNVGIGTTAPQAKLDISGGTTEGLHIATTNQSPFALMINNTTFGSTDATGFGFWQDNTGTAVLTNTNNNAISINSSGNVGIGTTTPKTKLEVDGELSISGVTSYNNGLTLTGSLGDTGLTIANTSTGGKNFALFSAGSGTSAPAGSFNIYDDTASAYRLTIDSSGNVGIGTNTPTAKLEVDGDIKVTGDISFVNADCAEEFDIAEAVDIEAGTVMVIDQDGPLQQSRQAYDKRVAGVVSGAGDYKPGLILDRQQEQDNRMPVALVGKVYCKVDAQYAPIEVGDLLTTSPTPGHAMKATDPFKAFGSVIGKALRPFREGQGLIPILIALQ